MSVTSEFKAGSLLSTRAMLGLSTAGRLSAERFTTGGFTVLESVLDEPSLVSTTLKAKKKPEAGSLRFKVVIQSCLSITCWLADGLGHGHRTAEL